MTVDMMWGALTKSRIVLLDAKSPWQLHNDPGGRPYYYHNGTEDILKLDKYYHNGTEGYN